MQPHSPPPPAGATAAISRQRRLVLALAAGLLLLAGAGMGLYKMTAPSGPSKPAPQAANLERSPALRLLVPAYFYPTPMGEGMAQWERILNSPLAGTTVVILNINSGPGVRRNTDYAGIVEKARDKGVTAIGYVSTNYAKRSL